MSELAGFRVELLRPADDLAVVEAAGELDISTSPEFKRCVTCAIEEGAARVVVDLSGVSFIDSSALGALVGATRRSAQRGAKLMIVCPAGNVARVIAITGLNRALAIYATRAAALGEGAGGKAQ
jgi:anti-sigma B factor antagonist